MVTVVDRIMFPQRYPHPNPQNLSIYHLTFKRDFADMVRDLKMGDYSGFSIWAYFIIRSLKRGRQGVPEKKSCTPGFKDGERGHKPRNIGTFSRLEKIKKQILRASRRNIVLLTYFRLLTS